MGNVADAVAIQGLMLRSGATLMCADVEIVERIGTENVKRSVGD